MKMEMRERLGGLVKRFRIITATILPLAMVLFCNGCKREDAIDRTEKELMSKLTDVERTNLLKALESLKTELRGEVIKEMARERREALRIEYVLLKIVHGGDGLVGPSREEIKMFDGIIIDPAIEALRSMNISGRLEIIGCGSDGDAKKRVRLFFVMDHQNDDSFEMAIPATGNIVCIQTTNGWKTVPSTYPTTKKVVKLEKPVNGDTGFVIIDAGSVKGRSGYSWKHNHPVTDQVSC